MNPIEQLMDALWDESEAGRSVERKRWSFSDEGFTAIRAAATPALDPFGANGLRDQQCMGLPYVINSDQAEPFRLEDTP